MFVHNSIDDFATHKSAPQKAPGFVLTIGNFDGCHLGHQALIRAARKLAGAQDVCVLTFEPRPTVFFRDLKGLADHEVEAAEKSLFDSNQKAQAMEELGVNHLIFQTFHQNFSQLEPGEFFRIITHKGCAGIVVGDDFQFGAGRAGNTDFLEQECRQAAIAFSKVGAVTVHGVRASSSAIRGAILTSGNVELAAGLLGREYALDGEVERGVQMGRKIGIPTANLRWSDAQIIPHAGVYAGYFVLSADQTLLVRSPVALPCVINVGYRPTVDVSAKPRLSVEAHAFDQNFAGDIWYGKSARIYFKARLRDEMKFSSLEALKIQIQRDIDLARQITKI